MDSSYPLDRALRTPSGRIVDLSNPTWWLEDYGLEQLARFLAVAHMWDDYQRALGRDPAYLERVLKHPEYTVHRPHLAICAVCKERMRGDAQEPELHMQRTGHRMFNMPSVWPWELTNLTPQTAPLIVTPQEADRGTEK